MHSDWYEGWRWAAGVKRTRGKVTAGGPGEIVAGGPCGPTFVYG